MCRTPAIRARPDPNWPREDERINPGPLEARRAPCCTCSDSSSSSSLNLALATITLAVSLSRGSGMFLIWPHRCKWVKQLRSTFYPQQSNSTIAEFLDDLEREKPTTFTSQQLRTATNNFSNLLGSGGCGSVYKGTFKNGKVVAVKVLNGTSDKKIEEQFIAEVSTMGRTHHFNLVRLHGFCFEKDLRALVYEYMVNGSLDNHLFRVDKILGFEKLHEIAVGTAKGVAYLHEECQHRIIHYDIKPGNILLDVNFSPKVADFGLAKLFNRENTHVTMTGGRGTPGYAAPELWMPFPVTHKCDVYSFGMLLFEIMGRRKNLDINLPESQQWFPMRVWSEFQKGEVGDLMFVCGIEHKDQETAKRMAKVALLCVQYRPESRPLMSNVVKMLEGELEIPMALNPFHYLTVDGSSDRVLSYMSSNGGGSDSASSSLVTGSYYTADTSSGVNTKSA